MRIYGTPYERVMERVEVEPTGCWLWTGRRIRYGYGQVRQGAKVAFVHRVVYQHIKGLIPDGLQIDHLCRNRRCVNPMHLEAVTQRENVLRGIGRTAQQARQTHCLRGHPLPPIRVRPNGRRRRVCLACAATYMRTRRQSTVNSIGPGVAIQR